MSPENISDNVSMSKYRLERAEQTLQTAKIDKENGDYYSANNRAYYAIFHAIRSVLAIENVDFKKHSSVLGYFNKNYISTHVFDSKYGKIIKNAFEIRQDSDYEDFYIINKKATDDLISNAEIFLLDVKKYLQKAIRN